MMLHIYAWLLRLLVLHRQCAAFLCTLVLFGGTVLLAYVNLHYSEDQTLEALIPENAQEKNVSLYFTLVTGQGSCKIGVHNSKYM